MRARVLIRPKAGILDPQGVAVERALPALGFEGVSNVHVGRLVELDIKDEKQLQSLSEKLLANTLIEDFEIEVLTSVKFGVIQFPGSCDERDTVIACEKVGDAQLLWHAEADLGGSDAIVIPGGFSYGDYLRVGAIAQFSPVMESVIAFANDGGPVLGICNGFQVLCETGLLPGALLPNEGLRFICRQLDLEVVNVDTAVHERHDPRPAAVDPRQAHDRPLLRARDRRRTRSCFATRTASTPTARRTTSPASSTRPATSWA